MSDLTKPLPHVVTALIAKRREIAGRIEDLQMQTREAVAELDHVEATLRIFKPDLDLDEVMPRPVPPPHAAFKGEVTRIVLDALRETTRPLSTRDLTLRVMKHRGLKTEDRKLVRVMQGRVGSCLNHWKRRGYVQSQPAQDLKGLLLWQVVAKPLTEDSYDPLTLRDRTPRLPGTD